MGLNGLNVIICAASPGKIIKKKKPSLNLPAFIFNSEKQSVDGSDFSFWELQRRSKIILELGCLRARCWLKEASLPQL